MGIPVDHFPEFVVKLSQFGHAPHLVEQGQECCTYITVPTLEMGSAIACNASPQQRLKRQPTFFNPVIAMRRRLGQGVHDRCEAAAFAAGTIAEADYEGLARHLPFHIKAISVLEKTIRSGEVWDVSVRGDVWGLDDYEDLFVVVNVGRLIIEPGGALVVRGNIFSLLCQEIVHPAGPGPEPGAYQIGILPTPFSVDSGSGPLHGAQGVNGKAGQAGSAGGVLVVEHTLLGLHARGEWDPSILNGTDGLPGEAGAEGARGRNGGMCKLAELTFRRVDGHVTVFAQAGQGGDGGDGGGGGDGGRGGDARDGYNLLTGILPGGGGGHGGGGGGGGNGGRAGSGGLASNIYINVPPGSEPCITRVSLDSQPGQPGRGGRPGAGGLGGLAGKGHASGYDGRSGLPGQPGLAGKPGNPGSARPAPWMFLNEEPL